MRLSQTGRAHVRCAALMALLCLPTVLTAQDRPVPDTYTAITTNMQPADAQIRAEILHWSTAEQRAAVVAALSEAEDPVASMQNLPTLGVVWRSESSVGSAIKYAQRDTAANGDETITLVTDRRVGYTSAVPWTANGSPIEAPPPYSVIVMNPAGGTGTMSLASAVVIDNAAATVSLARDESIQLLRNVTKVPPPYWATSEK